MKTYKLEKEIKLYKMQFDDMCQQIFQSYIIDRLGIEIDSILFKIKYMVKNKIDIHKIPKLQKEFNTKGLELRKHFALFLYHFLTDIIQIHDPFHLEDIKDVLAANVNMDASYINFTMVLISESKEYLEYVDNKIEEGKVFNMFPDQYMRFYTDSYNDGIAKAFPELFENKHQSIIGTGNDSDVFVHNFTFQVTEACSLSCFTEDTKVFMADTTWKNISDVNIGDIVMGFTENPKDNNIRYIMPSKVERIYMNRTNEIFSVRSKDNKNDVLVTGEHPFLTDKGWKEVRYLTVDDEVRRFESEEHTKVDVSQYKQELIVYNLETSTHTYMANGYMVHNCTYCYQANKTPDKMDFSTAKGFIDNLLADKYGYINKYNSPAIILEFIGGEPLLEIDIIRQAYEYFLNRCYELNHPWFTMHRVSICSNGLAYFNDNVQDFFKEYSHQISFNISIDGNKELHDSCRIQPNKEGSYDIDMAALNHYNKHYNAERNSKMTLAPTNIKYLYDSVIDFIKNGMTVININCVFEEGWNLKTAKEEYFQLKKLSDYIIDNDLHHLYIAIYTDRQEDKMDESQDSNFCFRGDSAILTMSGNKPIKELKVGEIIYTASGTKHIVEKMNSYFSKDNKIIYARGTYPTHCTSDHKFFAKKKIKDRVYSEPNWFRADELTTGDLISLPKLNIKDNKDNFLTEDLAYLLGVFLGDGHINKNYVVFTVGYDEDKYYYNLLKQIGFQFSSFRNRTTMVYSINKNSSDLANIFFNLCSSCGHLAHNKHFPKIIFESPENIIRACIRGYVYTDGYSQLDEYGNNLIKINSVSKWLMNDLMILLRSLNIPSTCYYCKREGKMKIEDRIVNVKDRYEVYYYPDKFYDDNKYFKKENDMVWSRVSRVEKDENEYEVYCPTVGSLTYEKSEHTLIVNGVSAVNCGGSGSMLSLRPNGEFYPCIRYMPSSIGCDKESICIGTLQDGMIGREEESKILHIMDRNTRRAQSNDICFECPIGNDCGNCSALGMEVYGKLRKRTTFHCIMQFSEALANVYFWNRLNIKHPEFELGVRKNMVPNELAEKIVGKDALEELKLLEIKSMITVME